METHECFGRFVIAFYGMLIDFSDYCFAFSYELDLHNHGMHGGVAPKQEAAAADADADASLQKVDATASAGGTAGPRHCATCGMAFDNSEQRDRHNCLKKDQDEPGCGEEGQRRNGQARLKCHFCALYHFGDVQELERHVRALHASKGSGQGVAKRRDRRPTLVSCSLCSRQFDTLRLLLGHMKAEHPEGRRDVLGGSGLECRRCRRSFRQKIQLDEHERVEHGNPCTRGCDVAFATVEELNGHLCSSHERSADLELSCHKCDFVTEDQENLDRHLKSAHNIHCYCCYKKQVSKVR